jgi:hypothetical protein
MMKLFMSLKVLIGICTIDVGNTPFSLALEVSQGEGSG